MREKEYSKQRELKSRKAGEPGTDKKKDVLTIEQPCAVQKFSAQEFLKALRSAKKNETILLSARAARKEAHPGAGTKL